MIYLRSPAQIDALAKELEEMKEAGAVEGTIGQMASGTLMVGMEAPGQVHPLTKIATDGGRGS